MKALVVLAVIDALCLWSIRGRSATLSSQQKAAALVKAGEVSGIQEAAQTVKAARALVQDELGLENSRLVLQLEDVAGQAELGGKVDLLAALSAGIESILTDGRDAQSPVATAKQILGTRDTEAAMRYVRDALDKKDASIRLMSLGESTEGGEQIVDAWILEVEIPELGDTAFFAVIDRSGEIAAYNYGFN